MPQYLTAAHSVCRKNYIVDKNGVAGAEPPTGTRGGSPTLSPGKDAGRVCPKALHDAEPTKHTQPFTTGKGFGVSARMPRQNAQRLCRTQSPQSVLIGIENKHFFEKTDFFNNLRP